MKRRLSSILLAFLFAAAAASAQNVSDLILSEVLAEPDSAGIIDDFGERNGWIELFNTSQGTVNLGGCFLTDDRSNLKKSLIPKGDLRTQIGPRQVVLFYANGKGSAGTFYADFKIRRGSTIYLVSNDGRTIIDSIAVPAGLPAGKSVSKLAFDNKQMDFHTYGQPTDPTPRVINGASNDAESNSQKMAREDPYGWILSLVSVTVVFSALAILWFLFWLLFERPARKEAQPKKAKKTKGMTPEIAAAIGMALDMESGGDAYAAIALALHLYFTETVHDSESFVVTIRPAQTQWGSKDRLFRQLPPISSSVK